MVVRIFVLLRLFDSLHERLLKVPHTTGEAADGVRP